MYCSDMYHHYVSHQRSENEDYVRCSIGDETSLKLGFDPSLVAGSYVFDGETVIIVFIRSLEPRKGHVKQLYQRILDQGYKLIVALPCPEMCHLCESMGMEMMYDYVPSHEGRIEYYWATPDTNL